MITPGYSGLNDISCIGKFGFPRSRGVIDGTGFPLSENQKHESHCFHCHLRYNITFLCNKRASFYLEIESTWSSTGQTFAKYPTIIGRCNSFTRVSRGFTRSGRSRNQLSLMRLGIDSMNPAAYEVVGSSAIDIPSSNIVPTVSKVRALDFEQLSRKLVSK